MTERIKHLTELVLQGKMYPEIQHTEYDRMDYMFPELKMSAKRINEYVLNQKPVLTPYSSMTGLFVFDGSVEGDYMSTAGLKHIAVLRKHFYNQPVNNLSTFEWQHATANYQRIVKIGIRGILDEIQKSKLVHKNNQKKMEFLEGLESVAHTLVAWAHKCSDEALKLSESIDNPEYKENLLLLSDTLKKVPENPATSFYEAILTIYVTFSYDPDSLGLLDRTLYEYYINDMEKGIITRDKAKDYIQELFLMLQSKTPINSDRFTRGGESHFAVGGYLPNHTDGFNDLSLLLIESMTDLPIWIPQISLRWTQKTPFEVLKKVMDFERKDPHKRIAVVNDEARIKAYIQRLGLTFEDACTYTSLGCNECAFPGGFVGGTTNVNGLRCVQNTFINRTDDIVKADSFDEFFEIFKEELENDFNEAIKYSDFFNSERSKDIPLVTCLLFDGCIEKADVFQKTCRIASSGFSVIGLPNVIDSLAVIKQFVYDEKTVTMKTFIEALKNNWKGFEDLHFLIKKKGKFFGNDDETSNYAANLYFETVGSILKSKKDVNGFHIYIGNLQGYNHHHKFFGSNTKATPDGRYDGENLKFGIGQSGGNDREGLTALLNAVAKCDKTGVCTGSSVTNIFLDEQLVVNDDNFEKTLKLLETYLKNGGIHFQLNYISKEELKKAKVNPEEYKNLRVRVSGYSDYFVNLSEPIQDDIIERTVHK